MKNDMNDSNDNALKPGTLLQGKSYTYTIQEVLGQGTFGITYLATTQIKVTGALGELEMDIQVAIKEFFMHDFNGRTGNTVTCGSKDSVYYDYKHQFIREAQNLSRFHHPHIVKVLEAFEENDTAYFAMEFIEGGSLNEYISQSGGLSDRESLEIILQIGDALSILHRNNMLHLDLKPLNVMRRTNGELVLIDFGLSKQFDKNGEPESSTHLGLGTKGYAPIERANYKRGNSFPATLDIYALGATLFKTLTGANPPVASEILNEGFPEKDMKAYGVSDDVILLTSWAMEPMKAKRPQSVDEFLAKVRQILPTASGKSRQQMGKVSELLPPTQPPRRLNNQVYEECNGLQIRWAKNLSEYKKEMIRELIGHMEKIGYKEQMVYSDYGVEPVARYPLMSLGDSSHWYLERMRRNDTSVGYYSQTIPMILNSIVQLEKETGLPFRLAEKEELRFIHSEIPTLNVMGTLCYSPRNGLQYEIYMSRAIKDVSPYAWYNNYRFQLVCDRPMPVYGEHGFNVPCTQKFFDEIQPIGFGLYKVRTGNEWNISSPQAPTSLYLPEDYDSISSINVYDFPSGGSRSGNVMYLGIEAKRKDMTYYYEFHKHAFKLIKSLSKKEIEESYMWT